MMQAFQDVKGALCRGPVLHCSDFNKSLKLQTDTSGIGAVLLQGIPENHHPGAYISRYFQGRFDIKLCRRNVWCKNVPLKLNPKVLLLGLEFVLEMDHKAIQ